MNTVLITHDEVQQAKALVEECHRLSCASGWWNDLATGEPLELTPERFAAKLCLIHSEISEAMEGNRKQLMDDKLPHRPMEEVELADAVIRIFDLAGKAGYDIVDAIVEKLQYNTQRPDHKISNRQADGGKQY